MTAEGMVEAIANGEKLPFERDSVAGVLWLARAGHWEEAHDRCQHLPDPAGAWIHAWLHRQEGDYGNACYWYARAGKPAVAEHDSLEEEWMEITRDLLEKTDSIGKSTS